MHTTQAIVRTYEPASMPIVISDYFEDERAAHSVQIVDSARVDKLMDITVAKLDPVMDRESLLRCLLLSMADLSLLGFKCVRRQLLLRTSTLAVIATFSISLFIDCWI